MIDRVLDRDFVLAQAAGLHRELEGELGDEAIVDAPAVKVRERLAESLRFEESRGEDTEDDVAWIPQDPILSVLQTAIEEQLRERHRDLLTSVEEAQEPEQPLATEILGGLEGLGDFTNLDPRWLRSLAQAIARVLSGNVHHFVVADPPPQCQLAEDARLLLVGDWGTGGSLARAVAEQVRKEIESAGERQTHVIHLGDVYYSGTPREAQERFLDVWPVPPDAGANVHSWALNANHDMYSGGFGYFETILQDERFRGQRSKDEQGVSYFRIANKHWQILGLDTAWDDRLLTDRGHSGFLQDPQDQWVGESVAGASGAFTMLLSHHQMLSTYSRIGGNLAEKLKPAFQAGGIDAWFWGHEHRCQTFRPRSELRYAACVGNSGIPKRVGRIRPEEGEWEFNEPSSSGQWRRGGFAVLEFAGPRIKVRYLDEDGEEFASDQIPEK